MTNKKVGSNMFDLHGRVAVVTGSSAGLGVYMAKALARQGAEAIGWVWDEMLKPIVNWIKDTFIVIFENWGEV